MTFIKQNIGYLFISVLAVIIGTYAVLPLISNTGIAQGTFVSSAFAFGVPDTGGGDSGGSCCGGPGPVTPAAIDPGPGDPWLACMDPTAVNYAPAADGPNNSLCIYAALSCDSFSATPNNFPSGGGNSTLTWNVANADTVSIDNGVLSQTTTPNGSSVLSVLSNTTYTLTATRGTEIVSCPIPVTVNNSSPNFSCASNISFTASDTVLPKGGGNVTLAWTATNTDSISINGIASTNLSGSEVVFVNSSRTYTLTAQSGSNSINCPLNLTVNTGGGHHGGGSSPRCNFQASNKNINSGDEIVLSWRNKFARDLTLFEGIENNGKKIFESNVRDTVNQGDIKVTPNKDTTYTLLVKRGSRDKTCVVDIKVKDGVVLSSVRNQGKVAGISLTQVPYTGFDAGPTLTVIFYTVLALWGIFIAYLLVVKEDSVLGVSIVSAGYNRKGSHEGHSNINDNDNEISEAAAYVGSVISSVDVEQTPTQMYSAAIAPVSTSFVPNNLPVENAVIGYASAVKESEVKSQETEVISKETPEEQSLEMKELEDRAHSQKVLLSSDAMRHLIAICSKEINRLLFLDQVIVEAKISYPSEDGWIVLNLTRMQELCEKRNDFIVPNKKVQVAEDKKISQPIDVTSVQIPRGSGSLAESLITSNIVAAYQMIGNRPMLALADAAADLDAVYRGRKGEKIIISDLLEKESAKLTEKQLAEAINALTSAIDGTYTDEAAAVKMAILKATKALASKQ